MGNLSLKTRGVQGKEPIYKERIGCITGFLGHSEDRITIDNYEGFGDTYKERELQEIEIVQNGTTLFIGDKYELYEILKAYNK
jgi:hypothetical protein